MLHLAFPDEANERVAGPRGGATYAASLATPCHLYLERCVAPVLRPLDTTLYRDGLSVILQTGARSSYVLDGQYVYWCIEWDPGLLVVRVDTGDPDGEIEAVAMRSPVPDFAGRLPESEDEADYDEELIDPQYRLIYDAWDAAFEADARQARGFVPATHEVRRVLAAARSRLQALAPDPGEAATDAWRERALIRIADWAGDGVRIPSEAIRGLFG